MNGTTIEKQIGDYLSQLSMAQKEMVLNLIKTIAEAANEYENFWPKNIWIQ